jgi:hypothetical protein
LIAVGRLRTVHLRGRPVRAAGATRGEDGTADSD